MALSGPKELDPSILVIGASRKDVIAKLGRPDKSTKYSFGCYLDTYYIIKGNEPDFSRAFDHALYDFGTFGLWEPFGTGLEMWDSWEANKKHPQWILVYDAKDKIRNIRKINIEEEK
jgi:hypothetical protein